MDLDEDGKTRVIEHGNPPLMLLRGQTPVPIERASLTLEAWKDRVIHYSEFDTQLGDRIVFFSDGVSQSGPGPRRPAAGLGQRSGDGFLAAADRRRTGDFGAANCRAHLVAEALLNDGRAGQGRHHLRRRFITASPARLLVITGPPFNRERDGELAEMAQPSMAGRPFAAAPRRALSPGCCAAL